MVAPPPWVLPTRDDEDIAAGSQVVGGVVGSQAAVGLNWWHPLRVAAVVAFLAYSVAVLLRLPCVANGFGGIERYTRMCYSDIPVLYQLRGFADGLLPYLHDAPDVDQFEYPVLTGALAQVGAWLTPLFGGGGVGFYAAHVVLLGALFVVTVVATGLTAVPRPWDAVLVAISPALLLTSTINWDMLVLALVSVWLLLWSRRYVFLAGFVLGLAIAAKFYPVIFLGPLLLLCWRAGAMRSFGRLLLGTAVGWLLANVPVMLADFDGWSRFYVFSSERGQDLGSVWLALSITGVTAPADVLNVLGIAVFALLCAGVAALIMFSKQQPRLAPMLFLTLAAFLVTNKVYSPQFVMWLVPLAVLSLPRVRPLLLWQGAEVLYFAAVWWYLVDLEEPGTGLHPGWYAAAIFVRVAALAWFSWRVVQLTLHPQLDPVRRIANDPAGGVLNGPAPSAPRSEVTGPSLVAPTTPLAP